MKKHRILAPDSGGAHQRNCNREEPILTPCWICFFDFNLCFSFLLWGNPGPCLNVKLKCFCLFFFSAHRRQSDPDHLWMAAERKKLTYPLLVKQITFDFISSSPSPLCSIEEPGIQTPKRWLFWDISLPSSQSANFPNKVIIPCLSILSVDFLGCHEVNRRNLDLVTVTSLYMVFSSCHHISETKSTINHLLQILLLKINTGKSSM